MPKILVTLTALLLILVFPAAAQISDDELRCRDSNGNIFITMQNTCSSGAQVVQSGAGRLIQKYSRTIRHPATGRAARSAVNYAALERAVIMYPDDRSAWRDLGLALLENNDFDAAIAAMEVAKAIPLPDNQDDMLENYRLQTSVDVGRSPGGEVGSACLGFNPPLTRDDGQRYDDYVDVKPALRDLVIAVRAGRLCLDGFAFGAEYHVSLRPRLPGGDALTTITKKDVAVLIPDRKPTISFKEGGYILPRHGAQIVPLETINIASVGIKVLHITERNLVNKLRRGFLGSLDAGDVHGIIDNDGALVFEGRIDLPARTNKSVVSGLKIGELIGQKLASGLYIIIAGEIPAGASKWKPETTQWLVVNDIGTSLFQGPDGLHVLTRSLDNAGPLPGVAVSLIARNNRVLAQATSNVRGYAHFAAPLLKGQGGEEAVLVRTESLEGGFGFVGLKQTAFDFRDRGVAGRKVSGKIDAYLFTERGIYRPGEVVHLTASVRDRKGNALKGGTPLSLRLVRPDGVEVDRRVLNDLGASAYMRDLPIAANAQMGEWNAYLHLDPKGKPIGRVSFQVADFVPPRIEVNATGDLVRKGPGAEVSLSVSADYFFGAPAAGLRVTPRARIRAQRRPYPDWDGFVFGLEEETFKAITVAFDEGKLDGGGRATLSSLIETFPDVTTPLEIEVEALVYELGGRPRAAKVVMQLNNLDTAIGIRPGFKAGGLAENTRASFEVVTLNREGHPISTENLEYTIYLEHRDYTWFRRHGAWDFEVFTRDEILRDGRLSVKSGTPARIGFEAKWGSYRLEVRDPHSGAASSFKFNGGWGGSVSGPDRPDRLNVELDREEYRVGETARVFVSTPFAGKLVLVIAGTVLETIPGGDISRAGKFIDLPVSRRWAEDPGAYIMAIVYRSGSLELEQQPGRAIGVTWLATDVSSRDLNIALKTPEELRPGQRLRVVVEAARPNSQTYVSLAAVDDAVLGLTNYATPNPLAYFFSQRRLAYEIRDTYGYLINPYGTEQAVIQSGGDEATARLDQGLSVRSSKVISLYSGIVSMDAQGRAEISFDIPQFSGRLRIMATAWNDEQLGSAEASVHVRDPVVADLVLPRFLAPGDTAFATATFNNVSGAAGAYEVYFESSGPVTFDGMTAWNFDLGAKDSTNIELPLVGSGVGTAAISMHLSGPGGYRAVKHWNLAVRPFQAVTSVKTIARLGKGDVKTLAPNLTKAYLEGTASVTLSVGSVPSFGVQALVGDMMAYPYRCLEQTTSRAMAFLFGSGRYPAKGSAESFPDDLAREIRASIDRLGTLQRRDGSFGLWSSAHPTEKWLTAYASDFLVRAKVAGFRVPGSLLRGALHWLRASVQGGHHYGSENITAAAYAHYVLARAQVGSLGKLRHFYDSYNAKFRSGMESAFAAAALSSYGDAARSQQARDAFLEWIPNAAYLPGHDYYSSPTRQVAAALHLAVEAQLQSSKLSELATRLAENIAATDRFSTQESAWIAMAALSIERWARDYQVEANGQSWHGPAPTRVNLGPGDLARGFSVKNVGSHETIYEITVRGVVAKTLPPVNSHISIKRELIGKDGKAVVPGAVKQGDLILVRLSGEVASSSAEWRKLQALVVDLLPAGLEIEAVNVSKQLFDVPDSVPAQNNNLLFVKGRDDRYVAALELSAGSKFNLLYLARAVTIGSYVFPAPYVENIYRPGQFARGAVSRLEVSR